MAPPTLQTLPPEILNQIIKEVVDPAAAAPAPRTVILVRFSRTPRITARRRVKGVRKLAKVAWNYACSERLPPPTLPTPGPMAQPPNPARNIFIGAVPYQSRLAEERIRQVCKQFAPGDFLQFGKGPRIYFRPAEDIIYFDYESFFNLFTFMRENPQRASRSLSGFEKIQILGSYHTTNIQGAWYNHGLRLLQAAVLTGLVKIQLLGDMGIHPGSVAPLANTALGNPQITRISDEARRAIRQLQRSTPSREAAAITITDRELQDCFNSVNTPILFPPSNLQVLP
jgi:hypothetical protein